MDEDGAVSTAVNLSLQIAVAEVQGGVLVIGGSAANDSFVLSPGSSATSVNVTVNGSSLGSFNTTAGQVQVFGDGGTDTLTFDDHTQTAAETYKITTTTVNRSNSVTVTMNGIASLVVDPGSGTEVVDVLSSTAATPVTINAGAGKETINVGSTGKTLDAIQGPVTVAGGSKKLTTVNLNDQGATGDETYTIAANSVTRSGAAPITFGTFKKIAVNGGGGNNEFALAATPASAVTVTGGVGANTLFGLNQNNTWSITGADAGKVGNVSFKAVGNLVGGTGVDVFQFSDGATLSGTINGGGGGDWLDYSAYTSALTVNLATGAATGVANGVTNIQNVIGGAGNDTLTGNSLGNVLVGGGGSNTLIGGSGRSVLIGGSGGSTVTGGASDDIVIGGTTTFDTNTKALASILKEWQRTDKNYSQRIADLKTGGGFNGNNLLVWGTTVLDNNAADTLTGGPGLDWFFCNLGPSGVIDTITDLNNGGTEQVN
jgi:Ca2+-binding RTX toxin-like protein